MKRFEGKVAVVTGASRGIGFAVARRIVDEGGRVVVTARGAEALAEAVTQLGGPEHALGIAGRAHDQAHRAEVVQRTLDTFGRVDVLVNNTGINPVFDSILKVDEAAMAKIFEVNVIAAVGWVREVYNAWMGEHGGAIVNVASLAGQHPSPGIGIYGASKAALINLTQQLAYELAHRRIRVNAVAPAVVKTRFAEALYAENEEKVAAGYPLGRLGEPDDIAAAVAYLASSDASWVTGQVITLDGGKTLRAGVE
ncbi:SDR family oxidoreductase [Thermobifida fusca]|uniref:3-ketoacyl-(Acyl-carrier-protein) reductase n=2 Tax=Thermobifida fusca TaxID=2021 RepID=A0A9P2WQI3_THEFU|nr:MULTISPECIES: SDR family oxidoreductase [Thermobifida]AAZ55717.1 putative short chain dehydrogenase [Thermobifida fusca YX]EOR71220.1 3-ketoacyl-(acyl-carrier-protein) reductase [Thermobifida fusca TM51]MBO2529160.1 NAD(P)-dependent oxidoreductase [Thermobifida sp.]MDD6793358.1 SDR family oxidoreductase [Thermobifida fusca]PPS94629.1 3-ketoacyl-ACP reductase [Thermobifida fusca]